MNEKIALLQLAADGQLDALPCPRCRGASVSVWFTQPVRGEYRTWFVCDNCDFELSAQNTGRPPNYSETRDRTAKASAP